MNFQTVNKTIRFVILNLIAVTIWVYSLLHVLIFNVDSFLITRINSEYSWLINYKPFVLLVIAAGVIVSIKNRAIFGSFLYVVFFPLLALLRFFIFLIQRKSWNFTLLFVNTIIGFFGAFKFHVVTATLFLISGFAVINSSNNAVLGLCSISILTVLISMYLQKFSSVFAPSWIYRAHTKFWEGLKNICEKSFVLDEQLKQLSIQQYDKGQLDKWSNALQMHVLLNRSCLFTAKRMKEFQESGLQIIPGIIRALFLLVTTVIAFLLVNIAIYKIDPLAFAPAKNPSIFMFTYYSFNNLFFSSIPEIIPATTIAQIINMIEKLFSIFLLTIFFALMLPVRARKDAAELNSLIPKIEEYGQDIERHIQSEFNIRNIPDAMIELQKAGASAIAAIMVITENIQPPNSL